MTCPHCSSREVRRSHRHWYEKPLILVGFRPYRCHKCHERFFGPKNALHPDEHHHDHKSLPDDTPGDPLACPECSVGRLVVSKWKWQERPLALLGKKAYRCKRCRSRVVMYPPPESQSSTAGTSN